MTDRQPEVHVRRHGIIAKSLHWGFLTLFAYGIYKQAEDVTQLSDTAFLRSEFIFAIAFLSVLFARFVYMRITGPTAVPETAPKQLRRLSKLGHLAIYGAVAMIALSGMGIGVLYTSGYTTGPLINAAVFLHEASINLSFLLIVGHVLAALFHRWKGDGIWSAMVPIWRERVRTS